MSPLSTFESSAVEYQGPNRRTYQRRAGDDRREMLRFELSNPNRRTGEDRRQENNLWNNLHRV